MSRPLTADPEALQILREIRDELRGLRSDLAGRGRGALNHADLVKLKTLLPAIRAAVATYSFTTTSLAERARLMGDATLGDALTMCGTGRALGKLLRRGAGHDVDGLCLRKTGNDGSNIYFVEKGAETGKTQIPG